MWTEESWSSRFLSTLALVLLLACFDQIILDQAPAASLNASSAQRIAKTHILSPIVTHDEIGRELKKQTRGIRSLNLHMVSEKTILTAPALMHRLYAEIRAEQISRHGSPKRPGFLSGRLVRTIYGRFAGLEQGREGNWN